MRLLLLSIIYIVSFFFINSCYKEKVIFDADPTHTLNLPLILKLDNKQCSFDAGSNTLRYSIEHNTISDFEAYVEFQEHSEVSFGDNILQNNAINNLGEIQVNKDYLITIQTLENTEELILQFTRLPIVQVITHDEIIDEPRTLARMIINYPLMSKNPFTSYVGIEHRGGASQLYVKKSFGFSFLNNAIISNTISKSIFDLPQNSDWWLDAMYIDKSRLRNKTSFEVWLGMDKNINYAINSSFVELYINSTHIGLYCINQLINAEFLGLTSNDAILYKAINWDGTLFDSYSNPVSTGRYWDGWEQKFPESNDYINWEPLFNLRDLVLNGSNQKFISDIAHIIDINSFIDYYIFLNLTSAFDNRGKNLFLMRKSKDDPLSIIPWDLDGVFGINWDGGHTGFSDILTNNLYNRLLSLNPDDFKTKLKTRWFYLRNKELNTINLLQIFDVNFSQLNESDIIQLENSIWPSSNILIQEEQGYINTWVTNRTNFLDEYYLQL